MSNYDDVSNEIDKSDDGRQTADVSATNIARILGLNDPDDLTQLRQMIGESGLSVDDLTDEILDMFDPDDLDDYDDDIDDDDDLYDDEEDENGSQG